MVIQLNAGFVIEEDSLCNLRIDSKRNWIYRCCSVHIKRICPKCGGFMKFHFVMGCSYPFKPLKGLGYECVKCEYFTESIESQYKHTTLKRKNT